MGSFKITVKQDVVNQIVANAQQNDIQALTEQFQLNTEQLNGDGIDMDEATHLPLDAFAQLSQNDTKITKEDLLKFAGTPTANDVVSEYANLIAKSIPSEVMDTASMQDGELSHKVKFNDVQNNWDHILVSASRVAMVANPVQPATDATAAGVFSIISGVDANGDGQIALGSELKQSETFVRTTGDALKIAQGDMVVTPTEALQAILDKAGKVDVSHLEIEYQK